MQRAYWQMNIICCILQIIINISSGEASITTSETDAVVYSEQSNTVESLKTPSGTLKSPTVDGNHNEGGENSAVLDQATNGLNVGEEEYNI